MTTESDLRATGPLDENPIGLLDNPGDQMLCLLIRVAATPHGLVAIPNPATVAMDDRVLWVADPGVGPFKIGMEAEDLLEVRGADHVDADSPMPFSALSAGRDTSAVAGLPNVWRSGASHVVGGWPTRPAEMVRYRLWEAGSDIPGAVMTLFVTNGRRELFGASGTVRPNDPF